MWQELEAACTSRSVDVGRAERLINIVGRHSSVSKVLAGISRRGKVDVSSIEALHEYYTTLNSQPPTSLIRLPTLFDMLLAELFSCDRKIDTNYRTKCASLLGRAVVPDGGNAAEMALAADETAAAIVAASTALGKVEPLEDELTVVRRHLEIPVVAAGLLHWLDNVLARPDHFHDFTRNKPIRYFDLFDEVGELHPLHRRKLFSVLRSALEREYNCSATLKFELRLKILDRIIYLFALGYTIPVVKYIGQTASTMDMSLMMSFIRKSLSLITAP